ncbi:MAG: HNH endonuclease [Polyangia bacterium]|jgi:putative restriction endonuclease
MKIWIGVTDRSWFEQQKAQAPEEVNFWQPGGTSTFKVLPEEGLFLFKLHHPDNFIAGGGYFVRHSFLPVSLAWKAFGLNNGVRDLAEFQARIRKYRRDDAGHDPVIGCIVLAQPFFLEQHDWIPVPESFKKNIVTGKSYESETDECRQLIEMLRLRLAGPSVLARDSALDDQSGYGDQNRYGNPLMVRPRLGQGSFRVLVTETYQRRCALTGERTLPVLEAAHIKPYAEQGPHRIQNGLLLRSDLHILFDQGYFTITPDHHVLVSKRIRQEFENGRDYYALGGKPVKVLPDLENNRPAPEFLQWHNEQIYLG